MSPRRILAKEREGRHPDRVLIRLTPPFQNIGQTDWTR